MAWSDPRTWSNGEIVTQTMLNTDVRDNMRELWHEIAYVEFTAAVTLTGTTAATAVDVVSSGALTYVAQPIIVEFYCPSITTASSVVPQFALWDATTDLGIMTRSTTAGGGSTIAGPIMARRRLTPTAASHTYKIRGFSSSGTATADAGAGGVGTMMPGFIRVIQKGGT